MRKLPGVGKVAFWILAIVCAYIASLLISPNLCSSPGGVGFPDLLLSLSQLLGTTLTVAFSILLFVSSIFKSQYGLNHKILDRDVRKYFSLLIFAIFWGYLVVLLNPVCELYLFATILFIVLSCYLISALWGYLRYLFSKFNVEILIADFREQIVRSRGSEETVINDLMSIMHSGIQHGDIVTFRKAFDALAESIPYIDEKKVRAELMGHLVNFIPAISWRRTQKQCVEKIQNMGDALINTPKGDENRDLSLFSGGGYVVMLLYGRSFDFVDRLNDVELGNMCLVCGASLASQIITSYDKNTRDDVHLSAVQSSIYQGLEVVNLFLIYPRRVSYHHWLAIFAQMNEWYRRLSKLLGNNTISDNASQLMQSILQTYKYAASVLLNSETPYMSQMYKTGLFRTSRFMPLEPYDHMINRYTHSVQTEIGQMIEEFEAKAKRDEGNL